MRVRNHFASPKLFRFSSSACACGKTGWLIPGIVFNYCARIACLSMACGIEIVFFKDIKKEFCKSMLAKPNACSEGKLSRAGFFGDAKKSAPPRGQGAFQLFIVFYKSLFAESFDPFLVHRPSVLLCNSPFYLFAHVVDRAYAVRLFFFHF